MLQPRITNNSKSARNSNFIGPDGLIYNIYNGDQSATTVDTVGEELMELTKQLRQKKSRVLILSDINKLGKVPLGARTHGLALMRSLDFDKVAITGPSWVAGEFVNLIILASGRSFQVRCFNNPDDAKRWLLN